MGVQPFGGEGLSGTGPKAGGPFYLARLGATGMLRRSAASTTAATPANDAHRPARSDALRHAIAGCYALAAPDRALLDALVTRCGETAATLTTMVLPGPTGETNTLSLRPGAPLACVASTVVDLLAQIVAAWSVGLEPIASHDLLPTALRGFAADWDGRIDALDDLRTLLIAVPDTALVRTKEACAVRPGPLVAVVPWNRSTDPVL